MCNSEIRTVFFQAVISLHRARARLASHIKVILLTCLDVCVLCPMIVAQWSGHVGELLISVNVVQLMFVVGVVSPSCLYGVEWLGGCGCYCNLIGCSDGR